MSDATLSPREVSELRAAMGHTSSACIDWECSTCVKVTLAVRRILADRLTAHEAREAELTAALEAGDARGAAGCRALGERDALRSAIEAAIDSLTRWNDVGNNSLVIASNIRHLRRALDGDS